MITFFLPFWEHASDLRVIFPPYLSPLTPGHMANCIYLTRKSLPDKDLSGQADNGHTNVQTDVQRDVWTKNLPYLQDFVSYRGRCPKRFLMIIIICWSMNSKDFDIKITQDIRIRMVMNIINTCLLCQLRTTTGIYFSFVIALSQSEVKNIDFWPIMKERADWRNSLLSFVEKRPAPLHMCLRSPRRLFKC